MAHNRVVGGGGSKGGTADGGSIRCAVELGWWESLPMFLSYPGGFLTVTRQAIDLNMLGIHRVFRREQRPIVRETLVRHPLARLSRVRVRADDGSTAIRGIEISDGRRPAKTVYTYDYPALRDLFREHDWLPHAR
jgi:hypothetical protein